MADPYEINHIIPFGKLGRSSFSCLNHQDNLEAVCVPCHKLITIQQRLNGLFSKRI